MSCPGPWKEQKLSIPDHIPDDIIYKFLLHLPVDSLLVFKSVCKSWLALISSPSFAKLHLATTNSTAASDDLLHIAHTFDYQDEYDTSIVLLDVASRRIVTDLHFPFPVDEFPMFNSLVGSSCGIVCVCSSFKIVSNVYLWNPATKLSKLIPQHNIRPQGIERVVLGFGFDPIADDFKVVRVVSSSFSAEVYSANTNAWRNVDPNPIDFPIDDIFDVCFKGFLCTAGKHGMIAFDLNTEVFNCAIKFPAPTFDASITEFDVFDPHARIIEYNDSIAAIICKRSDYDRKIDLWLLDDEACLRRGGIRASWTRNLNIIVNQPVQFVHGYFNGGDFLLLNDAVWYMYNPDNEEADLCIPENEKARNFINALYTSQIFRYTKSLFKIAGFTQVNWNTQEDDGEDDIEDDLQVYSEDDSEDDIQVNSENDGEEDDGEEDDGEDDIEDEIQVYSEDDSEDDIQVSSEDDGEDDSEDDIQVNSEDDGEDDIEDELQVYSEDDSEDDIQVNSEDDLQVYSEDDSEDDIQVNSEDDSEHDN